MSILKAAEALIDKLSTDGDPATILVPQAIIDDGPDAVNSFTQAFDDLAKAVAFLRAE